MSQSAIPDTESRDVAIITIAWLIVSSDGQFDNMDAKKKADMFGQTYHQLMSAMSRSAQGGIAGLR